MSKKPSLSPLPPLRGPLFIIFIEIRTFGSEGFHAFSQMVTTGFHGTLSYSMLTQEDAQTAPEGSHESRVWNVLPMKEGTPLTVQAGARLENWYVSISRFDRRVQQSLAIFR